MRLVICDDHQLLLEALEIALRGLDHEVVAVTTSPELAIEAVREHRPDVCLLDVNFPTGTGLDAIGPIRVASPETKVVMLSATSDHALVARAVGEGATGFVTKTRPIGEIVTALERAHAGEMAVEPSLLQRAMRLSQPSDTFLWQLRFLTDREWQVMRCLMDGSSTQEIAENLGVRRATVRTHVQNLLSKLGVHSRLQAAALMNAHASPETWPPHLR